MEDILGIQDIIQKNRDIENKILEDRTETKGNIIMDISNRDTYLYSIDIEREAYNIILEKLGDDKWEWHVGNYLISLPEKEREELGGVIFYKKQINLG